MKKLLKELSETPGVSGDESKIRKLIEEKVESHADSIETDNFGNLVARKGSGDKTLMIAAHMDQIGLTVMNIDENGFISFSKIGGVTIQSLMNQRVKIHTSEGEVSGVIGMKPPHLLDKDKRDKLPEKEKLFIDVAAEDKEEIEDIGINVGDRITFEREFKELRDGKVTGQALDNRVGCTVAIEALKRFEEDYELAVVFSTQEEVGLKGAKTSAFKINPDVALAVDVTFAGDVPGVEDTESEVELGDGIEFDLVQSEGRGLLVPETIRDWLIETAEENNHSFSRGVMEGGATDAAGIYLTREGIPTGSIGVPLRNMHSSTEVIDLSDLETAVDFLENSFSSMEKHF
jgi:endoglucanase